VPCLDWSRHAFLLPGLLIYPHRDLAGG
jgi:hypothetical protein